MFVLSDKAAALGYNVDSMSESIVASIRQAVMNTAQAAQGEWIRLAQSRLHTSRDTYVNGLRQAESFQTEVLDGQPVATIQLVGAMPNNLEFGMSSFDMKSVAPGWLGSRKAKMSKDGHRYMVIPFRHSTSSSGSIGYSGKAKAANLRAELKKTIKTYGLDRMIRAASGAVMTGTVAKVPNSAMDAHRFLRGLIRVQEAISGTTKNGFQRGAASLLTFRVISDKSAADAWVHPGLPGVHLLDEVTRWTDKELDRVIDKIMEAA